MAILLTLSKIACGFSVDGLVTGVPFLLNKSGGGTSTSGNREVSSTSIQQHLRKDCWSFWKGQDAEGNGEWKLIACKEGGETNIDTNYYLRKKNDPSNYQKIKGVKSHDVSFLLITLEGEAGQEEKMRILQSWNLGDRGDLKKECKIDWTDENSFRKLTCPVGGTSYQKLESLDW